MTSNSLGTFWMFGSLNVTRPVDFYQPKIKCLPCKKTEKKLCFHKDYKTIKITACFLKKKFDGINKCLLFFVYVIICFVFSVVQVASW